MDTIESTALLKQISTAITSDRLVMLRGDRTQELMAEICRMSLRHYSDIEHRRCTVSAPTMISLYAAGLDLNQWAEESLRRFNEALKKAEE